MTGSTTGRRASPAPRVRWSVRAQLLVLVVVATLTVGAGSVWVFWWSWGQAQDDALERMTFQAGRAAASISESIQTATTSVTALASQPGLSAAFTASEGCTLTLDQVGPFTSVRLDVVRPDGVVACSSGELPRPRSATVHAGAPWLERVLTDEGAKVDLEDVDAVTSKRSISVMAPIRDAAGGAVVVFLHLDPTAAELKREFGGSAHVQFALVHRGRAVVLASSEPVIVGRTPDPFSERLGSGSLLGPQGQRLVHGSADVADSDWRVYAMLPHDLVFGEARGALLRQLALAALSLAVLLGGVWTLDRRLSRPLRDVTRAAQAASTDADAPHAREAGTAETAALARSFNAMLDLRAAHEAQLAYQAGHDAVTGLPNRTSLVLRLDQTLASDATIGVVNLGVDGFRRVNDAIGHQAGDRLLREVADRLSNALRRGDSLSYFGSDQFVVLCADVTEAQAVSVAARMQRALDAPFHGPLGEISLTATAGVVIGSASTTGRRLLREADTALHEAKSSDRSCQVFDPTMQTRATAHLTIQRDLDQALAEDQLVVYYQPLIDVTTRRVVGAEALVRWRHPERGLVPPDDFIPVAEQTGQICAIGELVLDRACEQAVRWAVAGHPLTISVNVASTQLRRGGFAEVVKGSLDRTGLPASQLCLEITESSIMTASSELLSDLTRLRQLGVHLALDDFGTGYSSLAYLQTLPCDELKIDRSFVSRLDEGTKETHLVTAILGMARALRLTVVAEGVETEEQFRFLAGLGCQQAQGYLFSPPVPAADFSAWLSRTAQADPRGVGSRRRGVATAST